MEVMGTEQGNEIPGLSYRRNLEICSEKAGRNLYPINL